jgi:hypothetical protein
MALDAGKASSTHGGPEVKQPDAASSHGLGRGALPDIHRLAEAGLGFGQAGRMDGWKLTADGHGIVAVADLRRSGLDAHDVRALVAEGEISALARGWYCLGQPSSPEHRHVLTTRAFLRAHEGRALAGHHSALLVMELPTFRADLKVVRLSRRTPGSPRTRQNQRLGRVVPIEAQGEDTVVPGLAVVQHGLSAGPLSSLVAADAALRRGLLTRADLNLAVGWVAGHPESANIAGFVDLADGRRESPGETRLAHLFHLMRMSVTPQFEISEVGVHAKVDFKVDGEMVVVEFDGLVKYGRAADEPDPFGRRRTPNQVVVDEKRREDAIRDLGYEVVRVVWSDLDDPVALARRIAAAVRRARRRHGRPAA